MSLGRSVGEHGANKVGLVSNASPCKGFGARGFRSAAATVWTSDDFEQMTIRVLEVHAAAAVAVIDLAGAGLSRIGPIRETPLEDAGKDRVEFGLADEESIVLRGDLAFAGKEKKTLYVVGRGAAFKIDLLAAGFAGRAK